MYTNITYIILCRPPVKIILNRGLAEGSSGVFSLGSRIQGAAKSAAKLTF